jgi:hypothetical protein
MSQNAKEMIEPGLVYTEMVLDKVVSKVDEIQNYKEEEINDILNNGYTKGKEFGK